MSQNRLLKICGGIEECYELDETELIRRCMGADKSLRIGEKKLRFFIENRCLQSIEECAHKTADECLKKHIAVITAEDDSYPERFRNLQDAPVVLYVIGRLKINEYTSSIGIVGARRCSAEGKLQAINLAERKTSNHSAIISGLAKGIDSYAHTAALKKNGYTIAVMGNGPDICYPAEHRKLYSGIALHGCILSEYPPGTSPKSYMFPERNRLIAALSDELVVIDAGQHSGTETTVKSSLRYGRKVLRINP